MMMIRQWLKKRAKITKGILNTYIRVRGIAYDVQNWWDISFYTKGVSDRQTIAPGMSSVPSKYHYASMELLILRYLENNNVSINRKAILDIGSGSGHWIDFYRSLEARHVTGMDVSLASYGYLQKKYTAEEDVKIRHGQAIEVIQQLDRKYDLVNAIGVMFHMVDDTEWAETIRAVGNILTNNSLFVVGGHFGFINGLNVQIDMDNNINKRLRSKRRWKKVLKKAGFRNFKIYRNQAYLWINDSLPENHVLIASR